MKRKLSVLLIEDDLVDAKNFRRVIDGVDQEIELHHVYNTSDGYNSLLTDHYDIAFVDYHLPGENGLDFLRMIRKESIYTPVVIITSYADPKIAVEMMQHGASDYIPKTLITPEGLDQSIRNALRFLESERRRKETEVQLRKVENRLGTIISNTPIILFALDANGVFKLGLGKHWESFKNRKKFILGRKIHDVFSEVTDLVKAFDKTVTSKEGRKITVQIDEKYFEINLTPVSEDDGVIREILGLAHDVTERQKAEESLIAAKQLAEKTAKMKEQFIANMSHEIRTPMNAIVGFTNLVKETPLSNTQKEFIEAIQVSGENLLNLINDILDFSKMEAGKLNIEYEKFNLVSTINSAIQVLKGKAEERSLALNTYLDGITQEEVIGDSNRLYQILINLIGNAIKFTPSGEINITMNMNNVNDSTVQLTAKIEDTGIGIPSDKLHEVFDSFKQVSGNLTRKYGGTGLGLNIVKNLVEMMGGDIEVESSEGKGTVFTFNIPYLISFNTIRKKEEDSKSSNASNLEKVFKKKRILLAEDNIMNQRLVQIILEKHNANLTIANNGVEAIEKLRKNNFDLVLMDIQMPEMDGYQATGVIRNDLGLKNLPIIAMTAHAFKEEVDKCLKAGMNDHVAKPIDKELFFDKVIKYLTGGNEKTNQTESVEVSSKDLVNFDYLNNMSDGNKEFIREMIEMYKKDAPEILNRIQIAIESSDFDDLAKAAHKLKSPSAMMGMTVLAKKLSDIEQKAIKKSSNGLSTDLSELSSLIDQVIIEIESHFELV
jgi:signal transduction histidine kinase/CheY-like chemotaxis protein/HPt (histidine-containing phosphotransfer) domain-containing protein